MSSGSLREKPKEMEERSFDEGYQQKGIDDRRLTVELRPHPLGRLCPEDDDQQ